MFKVNVAPDMGMYNLLRNQGYDPAYALAEFVDNALQAHLLRPAQRAKKAVKPLKVDIKFYSADYSKDPKLAQSVIIEDSGPGIPGARLEDAMKPARPATVRGLNEFGIGMKAAAVWFTDNWSLSTCPESEGKRYWLDFNLAELVKQRREEVVVNDEVSDKSSGTTLTLTKTRRTIDHARFIAICTELTDIYQRFTSGPNPRMLLTAHFDDTPRSLQFESDAIPAVLSAPLFKIVGKETYSIGKPETWTVSISTVFRGAAVTGSISLLEKGSYKTNPGLVMFRHDRVICGTTLRPFLPESLFGTGNKYARQRVYGQIFVDDLPVTYTKDRFDFDETEFSAQLLSDPAVQRLKAQAEAYRVDETKVKHVNKEAEIYAPVGKPATKKADTEKATKGGTSAGAGGASEKAKPKPAPTPVPSPAPPPEPLVKVLTQLMASPVASAALQTIINETLLLHRAKRDIAIAMCLRVVLESGLLAKVERSFPAEYPKVSEKGVYALIKYLAGNSGAFFDSKAEYRQVKCAQSVANGTQPDVVLLNNAAHGHYQPNIAELNRFVNNLEPLLLWAYSA
ncbi:MAG TPA: ATP-binding protein [Paraburkholderia sp.]